MTISKIKFKAGFILSVLLILAGFFVPIQSAVNATSCTIDTNEPYTHPQTRTVWLITERCTKRPFKNSSMYFTYFDSWSEVQSVNKDRLESIKNDIANFVPYGPKYDPKGGALAKIPTDNRVYLLLDGKKYWITNEDIFEGLNYKWAWIQDIAPGLLNKYETVGEINYTDHHPVGSLVKYKSSPKVYRISKNKAGKLIKSHIPDEETFRFLGYRFDRIVTIPESEQYTTAKDYVVHDANAGDIQEEVVDDTEEEISKDAHSEQKDRAQDNDGFSRQEVEQLVHEKINDIRKKSNLPKLSYRSELNIIARKHSQDMADRNYFSHYTPENKSFYDRYQENGFICNNYGGENIAKAQWGYSIQTNAGGFKTVTNEAMAEAIVSMWMNSRGHKENILMKTWQTEGVGVVKTKDGWVYVTQNFC